ncbi:aldo/keto reductase [Corallococcus carmarthensis]|uniref:Aldo/keto reductase n=1 Tax=Corallococcus carmarthensis TaxID=2316728 RepID=A0A3A8K7H2_9BACT|nr:aldo/keto reductase [Corallococcus carmarthensis]NOK17665.1 aldo/keto reductase [Corallococcus carmarthensis]RKH03139.1 aldo/keto reductase [Corallococcus carmarthensis]
MTRKEFLAATLSLMAAPTVFGAPPAKAKNAPTVPRRKLGRTGQEVSCVGLGGFHIGKQKDESESLALIRGALDQGINFLDNCWDYNDGKSEERMGKALRDGYRAKAFLMTKIDGRDKKTAAKQIDESLQRLQTDHLDLLQLHEVIRDNDPDRAFAEGGAIEAMKDAQKAGKARFLGFTGHKSPDIHLKMLETAKKHGFRFDTVQLPLNVMDAHFNSFEKRVLPVLVKEGIGVLAMKCMGDPFILDSKTVTAPECLRYNLSLPVSVVITGIDSQERLQQALTAARTFKPLSEKEVQALLARTKDAARDGAFEKYKTSHHFDGTVQNPQWLG